MSDSDRAGAGNASSDRPPSDEGRPRHTLYIGFGRGETLRTTYIGSAPQGEEGSRTAATALVAYLNSHGAQWGQPTCGDAPEPWIDCVAHGPGGRLAIQVTRVPRDRARWQQLRHAGHIVRPADIARASWDLLAAIRHKGGQNRPAANGDLHLVLDGSTVPEYLLGNTLEQFEHDYAETAREYGFAAIWLVGGLVGGAGVVQLAAPSPG